VAPVILEFDPPDSIGVASMRDRGRVCVCTCECGFERAIRFMRVERIRNAIRV